MHVVVPAADGDDGGFAGASHERPKQRAACCRSPSTLKTTRPPVLAQYAAQAHADPSRWSFVTGPADDVERAVVFGFKVSAAKIARGANEYDVTHGDWFVLVDRDGAIRGYYPTDDPGSLDPIVRDVERLENK